MITLQEIEQMHRITFSLVLDASKALEIVTGILGHRYAYMDSNRNRKAKLFTLHELYMICKHCDELLICFERKIYQVNDCYTSPYRWLTANEAFTSKRRFNDALSRVTRDIKVFKQSLKCFTQIDIDAQELMLDILESLEDVKCYFYELKNALYDRIHNKDKNDKNEVTEVTEDCEREA